MKRFLLSVRSALPVTLALLVAGCSGDGSAKEPAVWELPVADVVATQPVNRPDEWWLKRHQLLVARIAVDARVVFVGDSITQGWEESGRAAWSAAFGGLGAVNLGISGDRTEHVLWRLQNGALDRAQPEVVVLMIGTNNTAEGHAAADIAAGVAAILQELARAWPDAEVLLLAVFPRGADATDRWRLVNDGTNAILATYEDGVHVQFKDIGAVFTEPDGVLPQNIMPDLLHLSPEGYQRWADAILPALERMLAE